MPDRSASAAQAQVVVAARDIPAGTDLSEADLAILELGHDDAPAHALTTIEDAIGQQVSGAVRRGEILTDARVVGPPAFDTPAGYLPLVVPVTDPQVLITLPDGACIDLYAGYAGGPLSQIADSALLISVVSGPPKSEATSPQTEYDEVAHLVVGVTNEQVTAVIEALSADLVLATLCHV